jgi:hypothetical protein
MPVAGQPRNPFGQSPDRIMLEQHRVTGYSGPAIDGAGVPLAFVQRTKRGMVLAAGQLRFFWKQAVGYNSAQDDYSWTTNGYRSRGGPRGFQITRALRYRTRSVYMGAGIDNTRLTALHSVVHPKVRSKPVTVNAGQQRGKPVTRNRLTSFGARVEPLQNRPNGGTL